MLEHVAEHLAVTEPLVAGTRERRMIRNLVLDAQAAEPAACQVNVDLAAEHPLRADGENVPNDEHPDHEHQVNRRSAKRRIVGRELGANPVQIQDSSNIADKMIGRNNLFKAERIEQLTLVPIELTHHGIAPSRIAIPRRNHCSQAPSTTFATKSANSCREQVQQGSPYSIASSAPASSVGEISRPRAFAVVGLR